MKRGSERGMERNLIVKKRDQVGELEMEGRWDAHL